MYSYHIFTFCRPGLCAIQYLLVHTLYVRFMYKYCTVRVLYCLTKCKLNTVLYCTALVYCTLHPESFRGPRGGNNSAAGVPLEDVRMHQCVRLSRFEQDRTISFVPPDGDFELLSYRFDARHAKPPIWVEAVIEHYRHSRIEYMLKVQYTRHSYVTVLYCTVRTLYLARSKSNRTE